MTDKDYYATYEKVDMTFKLDVFLLNDRITQEQYVELLQLMEVE